MAFVYKYIIHQVNNEKINAKYGIRTVQMSHYFIQKKVLYQYYKQPNFKVQIYSAKGNKIEDMHYLYCPRTKHFEMRIMRQ